jgi:polyisoprenoid-binding protein YceI
VCAALAWTQAARAAGTLPAPGDYAVDVRGSQVTFNVTNFLVASVDGRFSSFRARVTVGGSLAATHIEATVDVKSIDTGIAGRDEHLRSEDYFDVAKFPLMTFTSTMLWGTPENFGIRGNLTIKGTTREVVFSARILESGVVLAEGKIDRTTFGITSGASIKNEVRLRLQIRMIPPAAPPPAQ